MNIRYEIEDEEYGFCMASDVVSVPDYFTVDQITNYLYSIVNVYFGESLNWVYEK